MTIYYYDNTLGDDALQHDLSTGLLDDLLSEIQINFVFELPGDGYEEGVSLCLVRC
jgi:hypothetical protein